MATIEGGIGNDNLFDTAGDDTLLGKDGNDTLTVSSGRDYANGGTGEDTMVIRYGSAGVNTVVDNYSSSLAYEDDGDSGFTDSSRRVDFVFIEHLNAMTGSGDDLLAGNAQRWDILDGGAGVDLWRDSFSDLEGPLSVAMTQVQSAAGQTYDEGSTISNIERVDLTLSEGDDTFRDAGAYDDTVRGHDGNDDLGVSGGRDYVDGGTGDDIMTIDYSDATQNSFVDNYSSSLAYVDDGSSVFMDSSRRVDFVFIEHLNAMTGSGDDLLRGGRGNDVFEAGAGNDSIHGGAGTDTAVFAIGSGMVTAQLVEGGVQLSSALGVDFVAEDVESFVFADGTLTYAQASVLNSGGPDTITGTNAADTLTGSPDAEVINALGRDDTIRPSGGSDTVDGGTGSDLVDFSNLSDTAGRPAGGTRLTVDLLAGSAVNHDGSEQVSLSNVEHVTGTVFHDRLTGDANDNTLRGLAGNDRLDGAGGNDRLEAGDGLDTLIGGTGDDTLLGGQSSADLRDVAFGGDGNDSIDGGYGNDQLRGDGGNDTITGGFGVDEVFGGDGDDILTGQAWSDLVFGGTGADFINGGFGFDRVNGGAGGDRFFHLGIADHGSDWIQDYNAAEGDVLMYGGAASASDFLVQRAATPNAGVAGVDEVFVTHIPSGNLLWALVDGDAQSQINVLAGGVTFDLLV